MNFSSLFCTQAGSSGSIVFIEDSSSKYLRNQPLDTDDEVIIFLKLICSMSYQQNLFFLSKNFPFLYRFRKTVILACCDHNLFCRNATIVCASISVDSVT